MSALMTLKVNCDTEAFKRYAEEHGEVLDEIAADGKSKGAIHHRFGIGDGFLLVIDEWDSAEAFMEFFEANERIGEVMQAAGAQGEPEVTLVEALSTSDEF